MNDEKDRKLPIASVCNSASAVSEDVALRNDKNTMLVYFIKKSSERVTDNQVERQSPSCIPNDIVKHEPLNREQMITKNNWMIQLTMLNSSLERLTVWA